MIPFYQMLSYANVIISSCTFEEADQRIIRHAINLADKGYQHIQIRSADRDVIIVSIAHSGIMCSKE